MRVLVWFVRCNVLFSITSSWFKIRHVGLCGLCEDVCGVCDEGRRKTGGVRWNVSKGVAVKRAIE